MPDTKQRASQSGAPAPAAPVAPAASAPAQSGAPAQSAAADPHGTSGASGSGAFGQMPPGYGVFVGAPMATRREFARAAAAAAAAAVASGVASVAGTMAGIAGASESGQGASGQGASGQGSAAQDGVATPQAAPQQEEPKEDPDKLDSKGGINILARYTDIIDVTSYEMTNVYWLPVGCTVYADCTTRAAVIQWNESCRPLTVVGILDFATKDYEVVLEHPLAGDDYAPTEAHCTSQLIAWLEVNHQTNDWVLYAAPYQGGMLTIANAGLNKLAEGDGDWLPPQFAVEDNIVVWQVMPDPNGPYMRNSSIAYKWVMGSSTYVTVRESPGRFACEPNISAGVLTLCPRVNPEKGVYYAIEALDLRANQRIMDSLTMPTSVKPFRATRIGDAFAFSVEANYGYGGLLGNMGYYIGPGSGPFRYVSREPSAQVSFVGGKYIVKTLYSYFVIDPNERTYACLTAASGCVDYGDYPATSGTTGLFVTYATIKDSDTGVPSYVLVRTFSL